MILVDVHCHLDHEELYKDIDRIIGKAKLHNVKAIITNGINKDTNRISLELAKKYPDIIKPALGIYPPDALDRESLEGDFKINYFDIEKEIEFMEKNIKKFIAFGEIGLDLYNGKDIEKQKKVLGKILNLAVKYDKPVILHSRKAELQLLDFLEEYKLKKVILHCFSGRKHLIKRAIEKGYYFSVPTNIVKSDHFQRLVDMAPLSKLLTETDAPYLSPYTDKTNKPYYVIETIKKIAEIKKMEPFEVANNIYMTYRKVFE